MYNAIAEREIEREHVTSQTRTVPSSPPETAYCPLGSKLTERTRPSCPRNTSASLVGKGCRSRGDGSFGTRSSAVMVSCNEHYIRYIDMRAVNGCITPIKFLAIRIPDGHGRLFSNIMNETRLC